MSVYKSRYASLYRPNLNAMRENPQAEKKTRSRADAMKMMASIAPLAGAAIGGGIGSTFGAPGAGAMAGQSIGQVGGSLMNTQADADMDDERSAALRRQALLEALRSFRS